MRYKDEAKQQQRERPGVQPKGAVAAAVWKKDAEIEQLKQMIKAGTMSSSVLQPSIDAAERERQQLFTQVEMRAEADVKKVTRLLPNAVAGYRSLVGRLRNARELLTAGEFSETRALVFEMLGGADPVKTRPDGAASLRLEMTLEPLIAACGSDKSMSYNLVAGRRANQCSIFPKVTQAALTKILPGEEARFGN